MGKYNVTLYKLHVMAAINFNFISNNVKGLKLAKKLIKLFEHFKSKLASSDLCCFCSRNSLNQGN